MFIAFTAPLALFGLDCLFLGLFSLLFRLGASAAATDAANSLLWRHTKITVGAQLALGLLGLALEVSLDLRVPAWTKFFGLVVFSSAFVLPLALQIRLYRRTQL